MAATVVLIARRTTAETWVVPPFDPDDIGLIVISSSSGHVFLMGSGTEWYLSEDEPRLPLDESRPADAAAVRNLLRGWASGFEAEAQRGPRTMTSDEEEALGLDAAHRVDLDLVGVAGLNVQIGKALDGYRIIRKSSGGQVFRAHVPGPPPTGIERWSDRRLFPVDPTHVVRLSIQGAQRLVLARTSLDEPWRRVEPPGAVRSRSVDVLLTALLDLEWAGVLFISRRFHGYAALDEAMSVEVETIDGTLVKAGFSGPMGGTGATYALVEDRIHPMDGDVTQWLPGATARLRE